MIRLHAVVEGQTEETFVNQVLAPSLGARNVFVDVHRVTTGRTRTQLHRGGISRYEQLKNDVVLWMKQDKNRDARFTTMVDLYRLPNDFPGYKGCRAKIDPFERVRCLEENLRSDIPDHRFIPYIQLHEFETLLFSEVTAFATAFPNQPQLLESLSEILNTFPSPEHINENPDQSPAARILELIPGYAKPVSGLLIVKTIGLDVLRNRCAHFAAWMDCLEKLVPDSDFA